MKNKSEVINRIINEIEAENYLEIGYGNGEGIKQIECKNKYSVDPNGKADFKGTSDKYFEQLPKTAKFDVILVDGLHHSDQVRKDINNASKHLTKKGAIVLHDVNPNSKETQEIPCKTAIWEGDCWRAFVGFRNTYPDIKTECYLEDHGVAVIYPNGKKFSGEYEDNETTYEYFEKNKLNLLGV